LLVCLSAFFFEVGQKLFDEREEETFLFAIFRSEQARGQSLALPAGEMTSEMFGTKINARTRNKKKNFREKK